ncbi:TPA: hypothetical protein ACGOXI_001648 [Streptococcus suis]
MPDNFFELFFKGIDEDCQSGIKNYFLMVSDLPDKCNKKEYADLVKLNTELIFNHYSEVVIYNSLLKELGKRDLSKFLYRLGQGSLYSYSMKLVSFLNN